MFFILRLTSDHIQRVHNIRIVGLLKSNQMRVQMGEYMMHKKFISITGPFNISISTCAVVACFVKYFILLYFLFDHKCIWSAFSKLYWKLLNFFSEFKKFGYRYFLERSPSAHMTLTKAMQLCQDENVIVLNTL